MSQSSLHKYIRSVCSAIKKSSIEDFPDGAPPLGQEGRLLGRQLERRGGSLGGGNVRLGILSRLQRQRGELLGGVVVVNLHLVRFADAAAVSEVFLVDVTRNLLPAVVADRASGLVFSDVMMLFHGSDFQA